MDVRRVPRLQRPRATVRLVDGGRIRISTIRTTVALTTIALCLPACSDNESPGADAPASTASPAGTGTTSILSSQPPDTTTVGDTAASVTTTTEPPEPTHVSTTGLEQLLIGPADLPAELVVAAAGEESRPVEFCGVTFPDDLASVDHTSISYAGAQSSTYLSQYLARVDPASAPEGMAALREALAGCGEWIQPSAAGDVTYTIDLLDVALPGAGVAFSATSDISGLGQIQTQAAIVNVGEFVTWISYTEIGDTLVPPDVLLRYTDIAVRHLTNG